MPRAQRDPRPAPGAPRQPSQDLHLDQLQPGSRGAPRAIRPAGCLSLFLRVRLEPLPERLRRARRLPVGDEKQALEPVAFHGCLPSAQDIESKRPARGSRYFGADEAVLKVYVAFGTVVWRYWPRQALDALTVISDSLAGMPQVRALISVGGAEVGAEALRALEKPNVSVTAHADQWNVLQEADAFVTHNGLKSTHEAIFHGVPMISYPIFWDQPALAGKCRAVGVAIPLTGAPRGRLSEDDVHAAFTELSGRREALRAALAEARDWELQMIEGRDRSCRGSRT